MKVCFVMGSTRISGGTYIIFQHALYLQEQGCEVVVVPQEPVSAHGYKWHPALDNLTFSDFASEKDTVFDIVIATWWKTVYDLPLLVGNHYVYLVQSIETWFYPDREKTLRKLVAATYGLPLTVIAIADWIGDYLYKKHGNQIHVAHNGIRKELYTNTEDCIAPRIKGKLRVLVEGPLGVDFKNVARTIRLVKQSQVDEIWFLTGGPLKHYIGVDKVFSMLPIDQTPAIYRSCDVIVKLSYIEGMFGPPLEMFHCGGTAIVYDVNGHDEYIKHEKNGLVVKTGDEKAVVAAINRLASDETLLNDLKRGAELTAADWPDWPSCSERLHQVLSKVHLQPHSDRNMLNNMIKESWQQYCDAAAKEITPWTRINTFHLRIIKAIERKIPFIERERFFLKGWLWEGYRLPETRTKE